MNWNVVYGHSWPDTLYDDMVRYLRNGQFPELLPDHIKKTFRRRASAGYTLNPQDQIVLFVKTMPWNLGKINNNRTGIGKPVELINHRSGDQPSKSFKVVKESERVGVLRSFMTDMRNIGTNAHMLVDRLHRDLKLGISRRFVHQFLRSDPSTLALRVQTQTNTRTVIKSFRPNHPFEHWQMDLMDLKGPNNTWIYQNKMYRYVFVIIDIFTKFVYIYPIKNKDGITVAMIINKLFLSGDIPDKLHSDKGGEFVNEHVNNLCIDFKVEQIIGQAYSPQTQGFVENKNKQIKRLLKYYMINNDNNKYYDVLDQVAYTINNSKHGVTGFTPMQLHRGRQTERNFTVTDENNVEDFSTLFEEPADADLENHYGRQTLVSNERVRHVKNTLKGVASKREAMQRSKKRPLRVGSLVHVLTHVTDGDKLIATFIRSNNELLENPIRATFEGRFGKIPDMAKYPLSLFTDSDLTGRSKFYNPVFRIKRIVSDTLAAIRYLLVTDDINEEPVFIKTMNNGRFVRHFYRNNLVLVDLNTNRADINLDKIKPNPLFVDLHNKNMREGPLHANGNGNGNGNRETTTNGNGNTETTTEIRKMNSIVTILSKNVLLVKEKPSIFITLTKPNDDKLHYVYVAQIVEYNNNSGEFKIRLDTDPESLRNSDSKTLVLLANKYNTMHALNGWRFVEHNKWFLRSECGPKVENTPYYVRNAADVPLVYYKNILTDPGYTIRELTTYDTWKNPNMLIRYDNRTAALLIQTHRKGRKEQTPQMKDKWEIEFVTDAEPKSISLTPSNYGKQLSPTGWEFENFNFMFNIQLKNSINNEPR